MKKLDLKNPFAAAPVYYREVTGSTMDDSKKLAPSGILHGTVIATDFQEKGRGRIRGRKWISEKGDSLMFTLILRRDRLSHLLNHMPLLAGAALTETVRRYTSEDFSLKWPNDLLYQGRKCAGILCEADNEYFYCGMGINCNQNDFPSDISIKSTSLRIITQKKIDRYGLLEELLSRFYELLNSGERWRELLDSFLYLSGQEIEVRSGQADKGEIVKGINLGVGSDGQLLIKDKNGNINEIYAGEIEI